MYTLLEGKNGRRCTGGQSIMATKNEMRDEMIKVMSEMITIETTRYTYKDTRRVLSEAKETLKDIKKDAYVLEGDE